MEPSSTGVVARVARVAEPDDPAPLISVVRRLSMARTLEDVMAGVTHAVRTLLQADGATFVLRDEDRCFYAEEDAVSPLWKGRRFPLSACISGWCMLNRDVAAIPDIYDDARIPIDAYRPTFVKSLLMVPVGEDEPLAAMGAYWSEVREIRAEEVELMQTLAGAAALAVAYVRLRETSASARAARRTAVKAPATAGAEGAEREAARPVSLWVRLRRDGLRANSPEAYAVAVGLVAAATLLRVGAAALHVQSPLPFATYYPAVLLAMLAGGAGPALLATALGALTGYVAFLPHPGPLGMPPVGTVVNLGLFAAASLVMVWVVDRYQKRVRRLMDEDARHLTLAREQHHRVQNALVVIEMIVRESLKADPDLARTINQRIRGGLAAVEIRYGVSARAVDAGALLRRELDAFNLERFDLDLDPDPLTPKVQSIVALAARELATNAAKYGALSAPRGRVSIGWSVADGQARLSWRERGGPEVREPKRRGYGSVLLRRLVEAAGGTMVLAFEPSGLAAEIVLPAWGTPDGRAERARAPARAQPARSAGAGARPLATTP